MRSARRSRHRESRCRADGSAREGVARSGFELDPRHRRRRRPPSGRMLRHAPAGIAGSAISRSSGATAAPSHGEPLGKGLCCRTRAHYRTGPRGAEDGSASPTTSRCGRLTFQPGRCASSARPSSCATVARRYGCERRPTRGTGRGDHAWPELRQVRNVTAWPRRVGARHRHFVSHLTHGPLGFSRWSAATSATRSTSTPLLHVRNPSHRGEGSLAGGEHRLALVEQTPAARRGAHPLGRDALARAPGAGRGGSFAALRRDSLRARLRSAALGAPLPRVLSRRAVLRSEAERDRVAASLRAARSPFADPGTWASALPALEAQARRLDGLDFTAAHVELLLQQGGDAPAPLDDVARRLACRGGR